MAAEKKRPRGLKSSAAEKSSKKTKVDQDANEIPENAQTVVLNKEVEEGDEVGEAAALFESALEKVEKNPSESLALLRGTVHESDRILRNWTGEEPLPPKFYLTYGSALYELGRLTVDEEFGPFLDAAEERLQDGLDHAEKNEKEEYLQDINRIKVTIAKIRIVKRADTDDFESVSESVASDLDTINESLEAADLSNTFKVELAAVINNHGYLYTKLELREKFREWADRLLSEVVKDEPSNAQALIQLGYCKRSIVDYWLDKIDEQEDEEEKAEDEKKAYDAVLACKGHLKQAYDILEKNKGLTHEICTDLAEAILNEANLVSKEEEQNELYKEAVKYVREAQSVASEDYSLPEDLENFLKEWEADQA
ncbi:Inhibitor of Brome mosaic virus [Apophysomyces sp. BC1034]|nr:Inhibitor of Brome mosaic virus [Apophysomyces sp. BC1015]KAG0175936.1 Inhibitor of Brome mosaic virus [Apophysomyces sp. BC1021]KAG0186351.1 Inhibitor of Brome mosaic virus [Apophysomyces sp. BC1034]